MVKIEYAASGFSSAAVGRPPSSGQLNVEYVDVLRAAVTVGRRSWADVLRHGIYSWAEVLYRSLQVLANLELTEDGLVKSAAYRGLDASEKSAISYFVGQAIAKLSAEILFGVPVLLHINSYPTLSLLLAPGASQPDLVGMDIQGRWYVVEAKGRSNAAEAGLLRKAKAQTRKIRQVRGKSPYLRLAVVTEFPSRVLRIHVADPETSDTDGIDWDVSAIETLRLYYARWFHLVTTRVHEEVVVYDRRYAVVRLPEIDLAAGLDSQCAVAYRLLVGEEPRTESSRVGEFLAHLSYEARRPEEVRLPGFVSRNVSIGRDGILLALGQSWNRPETESRR